jgi:hypothetical protein
MINVKIDHTTNKINVMYEADEVIQGKLKAGLMRRKKIRQHDTGSSLYEDSARLPYLAQIFLDLAYQKPSSGVEINTNIPPDACNRI